MRNQQQHQQQQHRNNNYDDSTRRGNNGDFRGGGDYDRSTSYREHDDRRPRRRSRSRSRSRSKTRSRSRSYDRDRRDRGVQKHERTHYEDDRNRGHREQQGYGEMNKDTSYSGDKNNTTPTSTVMIKGLPPRTTEPTLYAATAPYGPQNIRLIAQRETGECKGFAFIEFFSVEYAQFFMKAFAGSCGDDKSPQLIIDNRAVFLEYAREQTPGQGFQPKKWNGASERPKKETGKSDWLCEQCNCQNFARRVQCFRCGHPRGDKSVTVMGNFSSDPYADAAIVSAEPCSTLAVRGFPSYTNETQITELFRQFAPVKSVFLVRDPKSGMSRGIAFVEFFAVDYSTHVLSNISSLQVDHPYLLINFAKKSFLQSLPSFQQQQMLLSQYAGTGGGAYAYPSPSLSIPALSQVQHQAYAAAALQAAQWSSSYHPNSSTPVVTPVISKVKSTWPLLFETNGASYIFQPQSGLFYDPLQKYYYCPKSKQYYNEIDGTYWIVSQPGADYPFTQFHPMEPGCQPPEDFISLEATNVTNIESGKSNGRKPIVLSMNLSASSKSKITNTATATSSVSNKVVEKKNENGDEIVTPVVVLTSMKKVSQDIAKWGERKAEDTPTNDTKNQTIQKDSGVGGGVGGSSSVGGGSSLICTLCRRQFNSPELLQRHENESKLHAENLAKLKAMNHEVEPVVYRDRASERRAIHGQSEIPEDLEHVRDEVFASGGSDRRKRRAGSITDLLVENTTTTPPGVTQVLSEDINNPGNQLLRRMGWNEGQGLGKDASGRVESIAESVTSTGRIQSTAGVGITELPQVHYNSSNYKSDLYKMTVARFEQISSTSTSAATAAPSPSSPSPNTSPNTSQK